MVRFKIARIAADDDLWTVRCGWGELLPLLMDPVGWVDSLNQYLAMTTKDDPFSTKAELPNRIVLEQHHTILFQRWDSARVGSLDLRSGQDDSLDLDADINAQQFEDITAEVFRRPKVQVQGISTTGSVTITAKASKAISLALLLTNVGATAEHLFFLAPEDDGLVRKTLKLFGYDPDEGRAIQFLHDNVQEMPNHVRGIWPLEEFPLNFLDVLWSIPETSKVTKVAVSAEFNRSYSHFELCGKKHPFKRERAGLCNFGLRSSYHFHKQMVDKTRDQDVFSVDDNKPTKLRLDLNKDQPIDQIDYLLEGSNDAGCTPCTMLLGTATKTKAGFTGGLSEAVIKGYCPQPFPPVPPMEMK